MKTAKLLKITIAMLTIVFAATFTACNSDDDYPEIPELTCKPARVDIALGGYANITVSDGTAPYTVVTSDEKIVSATVNDNIVKVAGLKIGTAIVLITDACQIKGLVVVNVTDAQTIGLTFSTESVTMDVDRLQNVIITNGEAPYVATVTDPTIASATINNNNITIKGLNKGTTTLTVTDKNNMTGKISITIK